MILSTENETTLAANLDYLEDKILELQTEAQNLLNDPTAWKGDYENLVSRLLDITIQR